MARRQPAIFTALRRGGSSVAFELVQALTHAGGQSAHDLAFDLAARGKYINDVREWELKSAFRRHHVVGPFRDVPPALARLANQHMKNLFLVRDPRDALLSWSYAETLHSPTAARGTNTWWTREDDMPPILDRLLAFAESTDSLILRYEDLIADPVHFIEVVVDFLGLEVASDAVDGVVVLAAFQQLATDTKRHNRHGGAYQALRVAPDAALHELNGRYENFLHRFDYPLTLDAVEDLGSTRREIDAIKRFCLSVARENAYRLHELQTLRSELDALRRLTEQTTFELGRENAFRIDEVAHLRHLLSNAGPKESNP